MFNDCHKNVSFSCFLLTICITLISATGGDKEEFDCVMREYAIEYATQIQPHITVNQLQDIADALNGDPEN